LLNHKLNLFTFSVVGADKAHNRFHLFPCRRYMSVALLLGCYGSHPGLLFLFIVAYVTSRSVWTVTSSHTHTLSEL